MVNAEKHRKLKENPFPFLNWNVPKRTAKIKQQERNLNSFINVGNHLRKELKEIEKLKL